MARSAILAIRIITDASKAQAGMDKLSDSGLGRFQQRAEKANRVAKGVAVGLVGIGVAAFKEASALQQSNGAVDSVFGKQSAKVKALGKQAASSLGLARNEYNELASVVGSQLGNMGVAQDKLVGTTQGLIKKGGDLAATFGGTTKDAVEALSALMRGEADPIERYGVSIKDADIKARLAAKGQDKLTGAAAKTARTQAILELLNKQTAKADGQRARERGSAAQAQEVAQAKLKNSAASLGKVLLPIYASVATAAANAAGFVEKHSSAFKVLLGVVAALTVATIATNGAIAAYTTVTTIARAATIVYRNAQLALNLAMMANPVGLVIAAIVILVGLVVLAYKKSTTFRKIADAAMRGVATGVMFLINWVKQAVVWIGQKIGAAAGVAKRLAVAAFLAYTLPIRTVIGWVRSLIGWIRDNVPAAARSMKDRVVGFFDRLVQPIKNAIEWVKELISKIKSIKLPSLGGIGKKVGGIFGFAAAPPPAARGLAAQPAARGLVGGTTARSLVGGGFGGSSTSSKNGQLGGNVYITIQGAIDPDGTAKQIERILGRRRVRVGSVSSG